MTLTIELKITKFDKENSIIRGDWEADIDGLYAAYDFIDLNLVKREIFINFEDQCKDIELANLEIFNFKGMHADCEEREGTFRCEITDILE